MRSAGIVRRIDHLGRLVIPMELRQTLKLPAGCPMEFYIGNNEEIIIKRYQEQSTSECIDSLVEKVINDQDISEKDIFIKALEDLKKKIV